MMGLLGALGARELRVQIAYLVIVSVGTLLAGVSLNHQEALAASLYYLIHSTLICGALFLLADLILRQRGEMAILLVEQYFEFARNLADSYVQTGLAIDPHGPESGGLRFIPGSHLHGDLGMDCSKKALGTPLQDTALEEVGLCAADAIDLVLSDVIMPGMGGREMARSLAASRPSLPVMFMSGYDDDDERGSGGAVRTSGVLAKPFTAETLALHVREALDRRPRSADVMGAEIA